jgi:hypothetical protein
MNTMGKIAWVSGIALIALCSACAKDHGKPIASLNYTAITARPGTDLYEVRFTADADLLNLFDASENPIGGRLRCAISDDNDFSVDHVMAQSARGPIERAAPAKSEGGFAFIATVFFTETLDNGTSDQTLEAAELNGFLSNKQAIPCKYIVTAYKFKPYYSGTLWVPTMDILREISRQDSLR